LGYGFCLDAVLAQTHTVVTDINVYVLSYLLYRNADFSGWRFTRGQALGDGLDAMHHRVAHHVLQAGG